MKFWHLLFTGLCYVTCTYAQNDGIKEKEQINGMVLSKVWEQDTGGGIRDRFTSEDPKQADGEICYYFDGSENLRKLISWREYPESLSSLIAYYNEAGELMYVIFSEFQPEGYSYQGIAYKTYHGAFSDSITFNYHVRYEFSSDFENRYIQGNSSQYPSVIGEWNLSGYIHVDSLKSHLQTETRQSLSDSKKVTFFKPSKNQTTFINSHNVDLREQPNVSSKTIRTMNVGERVNISDVLPEESVKNTGSYNWYKVIRNDKAGYIFGAFLEPAEKEVE